MEENKVNSCQNPQKNTKKNNKEIIEIHLGRPNPAFNLVSIKARYRFHLIKQNYSKNDYNEYLRKCKNMYSVSSKMSSEMNMSDIYHQEKEGINNILNIFRKIDDKISSKRIRLTKLKKNYSKTKYLKGKSLSVINIFKENQNLPNFRLTTNKTNNREDIKYKTHSINLRKEKSGILTLNNVRKMNSTFSSNFKSNFTNLFINNKINNTNQNNAKNNNKTKYSSYDEKNNFIKTFNPLIKNKKAFMKKSPENVENHKSKNAFNLDGLYNYKSKQSPISAKSDGMTITNYGGIIYNCSFFRKKNISNFLYNNSNLPIIYSSKY